MALLWLAFPAQAAPAPIVFDFEDGWQGWKHGGAHRESTDALGGSYAISIDADQIIWIEIDLAGIRAMTFDVFIPGPWRDTSHVNVYLPFRVKKSLQRLFATPENPFPNPDIRYLDLSDVNQVVRLEIYWASPDSYTLCSGGGECFTPPTPAFIDNITFHPVPEPSTLVLLAVSLVALVISRRRIA